VAKQSHAAWDGGKCPAQHDALCYNLFIGRQWCQADNILERENTMTMTNAQTTALIDAIAADKSLGAAQETFAKRIVSMIESGWTRVKKLIEDAVKSVKLDQGKDASERKLSGHTELLAALKKASDMVAPSF
jgi:hypothetical protein